jgi:hypothetical protein
MYCSRCGAATSRDAQFCRSCGAATPSIPPPTGVAATEGSSTLQPGGASDVPPINPIVNVVQPPPANKNGKGKIIAAIGAVVVVLIIILAVAGSGGNSSSSGGSPSGVNTNSPSYQDGYSTGQDLVYPGSAITVQGQCQGYYMAAPSGENKAEWIAGCVAGGNNSGNG